MTVQAIERALWHALCSAVQRYSLDKYRRNVRGITIHLEDGSEHVEPFPLGGLECAEDRPRDPRWAMGPKPLRAADFSWIYAPGIGKISFEGDTMRRAVACMWAAWERNEPEVHQAEILREAGSDSTRMDHLFGRHRAWDALIVKGEGRGTYKLDLPPYEPEE